MSAELFLACGLGCADQRGLLRKMHLGRVCRAVRLRGLTAESSLLQCGSWEPEVQVLAGGTQPQLKGTTSSGPCAGLLSLRAMSLVPRPLFVQEASVHCGLVSSTLHSAASGAPPPTSTPMAVRTEISQTSPSSARNKAPGAKGRCRFRGADWCAGRLHCWPRP